MQKLKFKKKETILNFACVDGPEFDGHQVDFTELMVRNTRFIEEEKESLYKIA